VRRNDVAFGADDKARRNIDYIFGIRWKHYAIDIDIDIDIGGGGG